MPSTFHLDAGWLASSVIAIAFAILYPLVLAFIAHRRLNISWKYFGYGALIFFLFQIISRVPIVTALGGVLAPQLRASRVFLYTWLAILALTAGLFEEVGRYVGYRWLMRREEKTWSKAVMYGIGHGGLESMVLIAGLGLLTLLNLIVLSSINLNSLPASQHDQVVQQLKALSAQTGWFPLIALWERLWTLPVQVALSVIVLQVFRRNNIGWLWLAILAHAVVDFVPVALLQVLGASTGAYLLVELIVAIFGATGVLVIWKLRDRPETKALPEAQPGYTEMPGS